MRQVMEAFQSLLIAFFHLKVGSKHMASRDTQWDSGVLDITRVYSTVFYIIRWCSTIYSTVCDSFEQYSKVSSGIRRYTHLFFTVFDSIIHHIGDDKCLYKLTLTRSHTH
jgi:hypothetical protein